MDQPGNLDRLISKNLSVNLALLEIFFTAGFSTFADFGGRPRFLFGFSTGTSTTSGLGLDSSTGESESELSNMVDPLTPPINL